MRLHEELLVKTAMEVGRREDPNKRPAVRDAGGAGHDPADAPDVAAGRGGGCQIHGGDGLYNSSSVRSEIEDAAKKAEEDASLAANVAATRAAEAKKAAVVAKAAEDSAAVAQSQLALAESEVKVEQSKIAAAKNLIEPDSVTA